MVWDLQGVPSLVRCSESSSAPVGGSVEWVDARFGRVTDFHGAAVSLVPGGCKPSFFDHGGAGLRPAAVGEGVARWG